ncbi:undecaprenyl phosphate N-acetylglucosaminyltransferase [Helicobacter mustelae]|uniref:glycosyltransferase family 4 protein n=1 Tax=Helicobacter mustelae TaxID=217 RepID=UPI000DFBBBFD|nr:MraY family glycosyltransferase [Helicobacter mustelae]STP13024.1 undecaprenyl phosphate N-acetylglucosaminyltransferase [Helicobacter mustelae]
MRFLVFVIAFLVCILCIFAAQRGFIGIDSAQQNKPQKLHSQNISRLGGIGIFVAFACGFFVFIPFSWDSLFVFLGLFVVFLAGLLEDLLDSLKPKARLIIQILGILLLFKHSGALISDFSPIMILPAFLAFFFTLFSIVGVSNALNIIDGLNGLSSGIALIVFGAIIFVALDKEVVWVASVVWIVWFGILGFFVLNFPFGKIFLGDGGAYFLGALIAFLLGVLSNHGVSTWFGLCVMIYPVWEVVFSIFRRKLSGKKAMQPDGMHLHSLLYKIWGRNAMSAFAILFVYLLYVLAVLCYAEEPRDFMLFSLIFCVIYLVLYFALLQIYKSQNQEA